MPLDGHSYLVAQGWSGKGTGLRQGAISRPLAIPQKKTLSGLGKDRDEAFPFWDHLFSAASKAIQLKIHSDDDGDDDDDEEGDNSHSVPKRTTTGILCNRRPVTGVLATPSGSTTPDEHNIAGSSRLSLLATAKREAARRRLYASFFRGPTLGPDIAEELKCDAICDESVGAIVSLADGQLRKKKKERLEEDNLVQKMRKQEGEKEKDSKKSKRRSRDAEVRGGFEDEASAKIGKKKHRHGTGKEQETSRPPDGADGPDIQREERKNKKRKRENPPGEHDGTPTENRQPPPSKSQIGAEEMGCEPIPMKKKKKRRDK